MVTLVYLLLCGRNNCKYIWNIIVMSARPSSSMRNRPPSGMMRAPSTGRPGTRSGQVPGGSNIFSSGITVADR